MTTREPAPSSRVRYSPDVTTLTAQTTSCLKRHRPGTYGVESNLIGVRHLHLGGLSLPGSFDSMFRMYRSNRIHRLHEYQTLSGGTTLGPCATLYRCRPCFLLTVKYRTQNTNSRLRVDPSRTPHTEGLPLLVSYHCTTESVSPLRCECNPVFFRELLPISPTRCSSWLLRPGGSRFARVWGVSRYPCVLAGGWIEGTDRRAPTDPGDIHGLRASSSIFLEIISNRDRLFPTRCC